MAKVESGFDGDVYKATTGLTTYASNGGVNVLKTSPGFLHSIVLSQTDAAPTAGDITIYDFDNTSIYAGGSSVLFRHSQTTTVFMPLTVTLDIPFTKGLAVGFTAPIKDVNVIVSFK